jgi:glyoxylase-like metal-dependent hydrolase (beta-lactamase superfamily II)
MPLRLGRFEVHALQDGTIALDGGAMFGAVPRPVWERRFPADDRNRVTFAVRCLLILDGPRRILVDVGVGTRWDGKHRELYGLETTGGLEAGLGRAGLTRDDITDVVLTHLHFDHAGGTTRVEGSSAVLAFPKATYHLQRRHWRWAHNPSDKDAGSFRQDDFAPLERSGRLHLLEGNTELYPDVHLFVSEGHTVGLQLLRLESPERTLAYLGDLVPTSAHLRRSWVTAYDLYPLTTIEEKTQLLAQALEEQWLLCFEHDPHLAACTVKDDGAGQVVVNQAIDLGP